MRFRQEKTELSWLGDPALLRGWLALFPIDRDTLHTVGIRAWLIYHKMSHFSSTSCYTMKILSKKYSNNIFYFRAFDRKSAGKLCPRKVGLLVSFCLAGESFPPPKGFGHPPAIKKLPRLTPLVSSGHHNKSIFFDLEQSPFKIWRGFSQAFGSEAFAQTRRGDAGSAEGVIEGAAFPRQNRRQI